MKQLHVNEPLKTLFQVDVFSCILGIMMESAFKDSLKIDFLRLSDRDTEELVGEEHQSSVKAAQVFTTVQVTGQHLDLCESHC